MRFGKLTVIKRVNRPDLNRPMWECRCDCSKIVEVASGSLNHRKDGTKSCGCLHKSKGLKHNLSNSRLYHIWDNMKRRCSNKNATGYENYGARGIFVCEEWADKKSGALSFINWANENGYNDKLTLERKNNNENYSPENCKWITHKEQQNNKRTNVYIEIDGETKTIKQWSESTGLSYTCIVLRMKKGLSGKELIEPSKARKSKQQSGVEGVVWDSSRNNWRITHKGKYIKRVKNLEEAVLLKQEIVKGE